MECDGSIDEKRDEVVTKIDRTDVKTRLENPSNQCDDEGFEDDGDAVLQKYDDDRRLPPSAKKMYVIFGYALIGLLTVMLYGVLSYHFVFPITVSRAFNCVSSIVTATCYASFVRDVFIEERTNHVRLYVVIAICSLSLASKQLFYAFVSNQTLNAPFLV